MSKAVVPQMLIHGQQSAQFIYLNSGRIFHIEQVKTIYVHTHLEVQPSTVWLCTPDPGDVTGPKKAFDLLVNCVISDMPALNHVDIKSHCIYIGMYFELVALYQVSGLNIDNSIITSPPGMESRAKDSQNTLFLSTFKQNGRGWVQFPLAPTPVYCYHSGLDVRSTGAC